MSRGAGLLGVVKIKKINKDGLGNIKREIVFTGVLVTPDGVVLTSGHCFQEWDESSCLIVTYNEIDYTASLVECRDDVYSLDFALLKIVNAPATQVFERVILSSVSKTNFTRKVDKVMCVGYQADLIPNLTTSVVNRVTPFSLHNSFSVRGESKDGDHHGMSGGPWNYTSDGYVKTVAIQSYQGDFKKKLVTATPVSEIINVSETARDIYNEYHLLYDKGYDLCELIYGPTRSSRSKSNIRSFQVAITTTQARIKGFDEICFATQRKLDEKLRYLSGFFSRPYKLNIDLVEKVVNQNNPKPAVDHILAFSRSSLRCVVDMTNQLISSNLRELRNDHLSHVICVEYNDVQSLLGDAFVDQRLIIDQNRRGHYREDIKTICTDIALDICMFRSFRYLSEIYSTPSSGLKFSKMKVEFAKQRNMLVYGGVIPNSNDLSYISFASLCRPNLDVDLNLPGYLNLWISFFEHVILKNSPNLILDNVVNDELQLMQKVSNRFKISDELVEKEYAKFQRKDRERAASSAYRDYFYIILSRKVPSTERRRKFELILGKGYKRGRIKFVCFEQFKQVIDVEGELGLYNDYLVVKKGQEWGA